MRILVLAVTFPRPNNPLTGTWALKQAHSLRDAGHEVRVVVVHSWVPKWFAVTRGARLYAECPRSFDFDGVTAVYPRVPYYYTGPMRRRTIDRPARWLRLAWPWLRRALVRQVDDFKPDVIWAHHSTVGGLAAHWLRRSRRVPFVTIDHDLDDMKLTRINPHRSGPLAGVWNDAACCVGITNAMSAVIRETAPAARVETVHNGFDLAVASDESSMSSRDDEAKVTVLSLGGFFTRKNMPLLVRAFAKVAPQHPTAYLKIIGGGAEWEAVHALVAELNMTDRIDLPGPLPHAEALAAMAEADVFALVGYDEPFATVYVEAMAHALPIVCGNDGGINDVLIDGQTALSVPPRDVDAVAAALNVLLSDPALRRRLGAAAQTLYHTTLTGHRWAERMTEIFTGTVHINPSAAR